MNLSKAFMKQIYWGHWTQTSVSLFKGLVYEQKWDILSICCDGELFKQFIYFQKCACVDNAQHINCDFRLLFLGRWRVSCRRTGRGQDGHMIRSFREISV
jgi:hypothetical protein